MSLNSVLSSHDRCVTLNIKSLQIPSALGKFDLLDLDAFLSLEISQLASNLQLLNRPLRPYPLVALKTDTACLC